MKRVEFVFFDAGGGHRSAANALKAAVEQQERHWDVRLVNLQEELDALDVFRKLTRIRLQDLYNHMLARGWTLGSEYLLPAMQLVIRAYHPAQVRMLAQAWADRKPDMVVSVVPNFNRALFEGLQRWNPKIPYVTVLTDFADYPPHFWLERQDQFVICGTRRAYQQALATGIQPNKVFRTSGMILSPSFYSRPEVDRILERRKLGLEPHRRTGLMLFGGHGSNVMLKITRTLQDTHLDLQLIVICGRNARLAEAIKTIPLRMPVHVVGFTSQVPYYMSLADFFIGKPGPGSISEALAMTLPVIVERNSWTLPQERYNADWVKENQVGLVVENFSAIREAVESLLQPSQFERYRANAAALRNCAVFEIPEILESILQGNY